eukprot:CAMPEP_0179297704 /NCGR_PEP_ID=MMETSP0797-20121207/45606_1 /TAXON_ID=47934 /ORGANISM="Dinophysis acuminata, Strain DAEP01" /LENGTH=67 /DNA_ID=CAMNT_0021007051 /DNA_START=173 /DNA_END=376 /DNA_ORIENTATION=+
MAGEKPSCSCDLPLMALSFACACAYLESIAESLRAMLCTRRDAISRAITASKYGFAQSMAERYHALP